MIRTRVRLQLRRAGVVTFATVAIVAMACAGNDEEFAAGVPTSTRSLVASPATLATTLSATGQVDASPTETIVAPPPDTEGEFLFANQGCGTCHSTGDDRIIGPGLSGLSERAGTRDPETTAVEYVTQSIRAPNAYIVPDFFPDIMPGTFSDSMTGDEIEELVDFLLMLP